MLGKRLLWNGRDKTRVKPECCRKERMGDMKRHLLNVNESFKKLPVRTHRTLMQYLTENANFLRLKSIM